MIGFRASAARHKRTCRSTSNASRRTSNWAAGNGTVWVPVLGSGGAPPVMMLTASPKELSPANGELRDVQVIVEASDKLSGVDRFELVSIEISDTRSNGDDVQEWDIGSADTSGRLRATAGKDARIYALRYRIVDEAGNVGESKVKVAVPPR